MICHQVAAMLHLHQNRCCFAAAPNRRTAVEYALHLVWLADQGDEVVDVLNRGLQNDQKQLANRLRQAGQTGRYPQESYQALLDTVATQLPPAVDERLRKIDHLLDEYAPELKAYYHTESRFSHVSLTAVQLFAISSGDDLLLVQSPLHEELVPCQQVCLNLLFDAMLAFNTLLAGHPWTDALTQIATDHGLTQQLPSRRSSLRDQPG